MSINDKTIVIEDENKSVITLQKKQFEKEQLDTLVETISKNIEGDLIESNVSRDYGENKLQDIWWEFRRFFAIKITFVVVHLYLSLSRNYQPGWIFTIVGLSLLMLNVVYYFLCNKAVLEHKEGAAKKIKLIPFLFAFSMVANFILRVFAYHEYSVHIFISTAIALAYSFALYLFLTNYLKEF